MVPAYANISVALRLYPLSAVRPGAFKGLLKEVDNERRDLSKRDQFQTSFSLLGEGLGMRAVRGSARLTALSL